MWTSTPAWWWCRLLGQLNLDRLRVRPRGLRKTVLDRRLAAQDPNESVWSFRRLVRVPMPIWGMAGQALRPGGGAGTAVLVLQRAPLRSAAQRPDAGAQAGHRLAPDVGAARRWRAGPRRQGHAVGLPDGLRRGLAHDRQPAPLAHHQPRRRHQRHAGRIRWRWPAAPRYRPAWRTPARRSSGRSRRCRSARGPGQ